jgi:hypothetical protein
VAPERRAPGGQVLDEADVEHVVRLAVELARAELVVHVAVQPGVVQEHAGVFQADRRQRRRQVELHAPDLAVAGVAGRVDERAGALVAFLAGVGQLDQVLDLAVEDVDPEYALFAQPALIAGVQAPGAFRLQVRIADEVVVAHSAVSRAGDR